MDRPALEAVILVGLQATGKSTFYQQMFFHTHVRLSLDLLKTHNRERVFLQACLQLQQPFVVDNTNPTPAERGHYILSARAAGFTIVGYFFPTTLEESLQRNSARPEIQQIGEAAINVTYRKLARPTYEEGFDILYTVQIGTPGNFVIEEQLGSTESHGVEEQIFREA